MGDVGAVATLAQAIFSWVTEPEGYHDLSFNRKLRALHDASQKALANKDFASLDLLLREYRRLSDTYV